jgi:hypothetical protein
MKKYLVLFIVLFFAVSGFAKPPSAPPTPKTGLKTYTVATRPDVAVHINMAIIITDGATDVDCESTGGGAIQNVCVSDGTNWLISGGADPEEETHAAEHTIGGGDVTDRQTEGTTVTKLTAGTATPTVVTKGSYDCTDMTTITITDFNGTFTDGDYFYLKMNDADVTIDCSTNAEIECNVNTDFTGSSDQIETHLFVYGNSKWHSPTLSQGKSSPTVLAIDSLRVPIDMTTTASDVSVAAEDMNTILIMTGAADATLPDVCDSATGEWLTVVANGAHIASIQSADTADQFVTVDGTVNTANHELDTAGGIWDYCKVVCVEANVWMVMDEIGTCVDHELD